MVFYKNKVWLIFFFSLLSITLYYTSIALYDLYKYSVLTEEVVATEVVPLITKKHDESYLLAVKYSFVYQDRSYTSEDHKLYHPFWNEWAAEREGKALAAKKHTIFFSSSNPLVSSLQKSFPLKALLSALVLWGAQVYLFFVGKKYA